jgi:hypothetical protein
MFTLWGNSHRTCDGVSRRDFLRAGALGLGGLGLADVLRFEASAQTPQATPQATPQRRRQKSIIYIVLGGGLSHIDSYDPKPDAPREIRSEFATIPTCLPGVRFTEYLPIQARMMDRLALVRGVRSVENDHFLSEVYSGLPRTAGHRPAFGCVASRLATTGTALPTYVCLSRETTDQFEFERPYYAGAGHAPFRPFGAALENLRPVPSLDQLQERRQLLEAFDDFRRDADVTQTAAGMDAFQERALEIMTSPQVRDAFDLGREPSRLIDAYGRGRYQYITVRDLFYDWDPRPFVLARRLVEAGVRVVTLRVGQWDHHSGFPGSIFPCLASALPLVDRSIAMLVEDLHQRGLGNDVLVVLLSEFGRTPRISSPGPGREHWAEAGCAVFAGGGLQMGQVIGETDSRGERARTGRVTFQNIFATMYHVLGIDPETRLTDFNGRPQYLLEEREAIGALVG